MTEDKMDGITKDELDSYIEYLDSIKNNDI